MVRSLLLLAVATACGGTDDLTCDLLADPGNCWATAAAAMKGCLPAETGVLAADRASCTFSDGTVVTFDAPLPNDVFALDGLGFTIQKSGATCARFVDTFMNRMELEAGGQGAVSELHPGGEFHLHCEGGPSYGTDFDSLFTCQGGTLPTDGFDVSATEFMFTIVSVSTPGELFRCAAP